jgi:hypothetical protein
MGRELGTLSWRTFTDMRRNPALLLMHWATALAMGLVTGLLFLNTPATLAGAQDRGGAPAGA